LMHWEGDTIISDGMDKAAAEEIRQKKVLSRVNRVLMAEGYILLYTYDPEKVGRADALRGVTLERFVPKDETQQLPGVGG
jgi:hypothetical protein